MENKIKTEHPYIVKAEGVCGGRPIIDGTRISVRDIIEYLHVDYSPDQICDALRVSQAEIYDAISYYYDHKEEIDKEISLNDPDYWLAKSKEWGLPIMEPGYNNGHLKLISS